jgi:hypothetical protein
MDGGVSVAGEKSAASRVAAAPARKTVNLALQGGGSHGAYSWGALDALIEDERVEIGAISGASAGAKLWLAQNWDSIGLRSTLDIDRALARGKLSGS